MLPETSATVETTKVISSVTTNEKTAQLENFDEKKSKQESQSSSSLVIKSISSCIGAVINSDLPSNARKSHHTASRSTRERSFSPRTENRHGYLNFFLFIALLVLLATIPFILNFQNKN